MVEYLIIYEIHDFKEPTLHSEVVKAGDKSTYRKVHDAFIAKYPASHIVVKDIKKLTKKPESN